LRRALVVYRESATRLRADAASVPPDALTRTAKLFRTFGEDYHERAVEEAYVLPKIDPALAAAIKAQHDRGRAIQDWLVAVLGAGKIGARAQDVAKVLDGFARMYETHAAREDTIVFPAWKKALGEKAVHEMGERFEDIEKKTLGPEGFEHAEKEMTAIEQSLGLSDLRFFDAPAPPQA
jgi:hemerythrin-like domain-containing protein